MTLRSTGCIACVAAQHGFACNGGFLASRANHASLNRARTLLKFFAASADTLAASLGWACYALASWPRVQATLREAMAGLETDPGWPALAAFAPPAGFLSEVPRPPPPILARLATQPDHVSGEPIAVGQNALISLIDAGHDTQLRDSPWELTPEDARPSGDAGRQLAFGAGAGVCGGKQLALVGVMAFLEVFLRHAQFELTSNASPRFHWKAQMLRAGGRYRSLVSEWGGEAAAQL